MKDGYQIETKPMLSDQKKISDKKSLLVSMEVKDRFNIVYFIMVLQGVGTLLPWNMFITAHAYFIKKFENKHGLEHSFENYFSVAAMVPNVLMFLLNTLFKHKFSLKLRMVSSLVVMILMFVLTTVLVKIDTTAWTENFFFLTIGTIVCINMVSAVYQGGLFGLSGMLPPKYTGAVMTGQGVGGSFAAVASILSLVGGKGPIESGFGYFLSAVIVLFLCFVSYIMLFRMEFARHHLGMGKRRTEVSAVNPSIQSSRLANWQVPVPQKKKPINHKPGSFSHSTLSLDANTCSYLSPQLDSREVGLIKKDRPPFFLIIRQISKFGLSVMFVFFVTLAAFPSLTSRIHSKDYGDNSPWTTTYFVPVTCFLLFNLGDFGGRLAASFAQWPGKDSIMLPLLCFLRVVFLPLFAFCNAQPRSSPVLFHDDWYPITFMILFALSNGYLGSLCMMYGPSCVEGQHAETAGTIMAFFLVIGLGMGAGFSFVITLNL